MEKTGTTSMTISARAERRERDSDFVETVATGRFTFVAVDEANRPRPCTPD
jgi:acyl-CoA hydrolase